MASGERLPGTNRALRDAGRRRFALPHLRLPRGTLANLYLALLLHDVPGTFLPFLIVQEEKTGV